MATSKTKKKATKAAPKAVKKKAAKAKAKAKPAKAAVKGAKLAAKSKPARKPNTKAVVKAKGKPVVKAAVKAVTKTSAAGETKAKVETKNPAGGPSKTARATKAARAAHPAPIKVMVKDERVYSHPTMCLHCHLIVEMFHERGADPVKGAWQCPRCGHKYLFSHWKIKRQARGKSEAA